MPEWLWNIHSVGTQCTLASPSFTFPHNFQKASSDVLVSLVTSLVLSFPIRRQIVSCWATTSDTVVFQLQDADRFMPMAPLHLGPWPCRSAQWCPVGCILTDWQVDDVVYDLSSIQPCSTGDSGSWEWESPSVAWSPGSHRAVTHLVLGAFVPESRMPGPQQTLTHWETAAPALFGNCGPYDSCQLCLEGNPLFLYFIAIITSRHLLSS